MRDNWFLSRKEETEADDGGEGIRSGDIETFLTYDWTKNDILLHFDSVTPLDTGLGWEFSLADVDFDGGLDMLITFAAMHCGENSLYIYRQDVGEVFPLADIIATFRKYVTVELEEFEWISPYFDIDLLDAYVNEEGNCRYLSLDYSLHGGDARGNLGDVALYSTVLEDGAESIKVVEIDYCGPEETKELFILGEQVYELGRLADLLEKYMDGYTKAEMECVTADMSFPRDIVSMDESEKVQCLEELYGALKACFKEAED